MLYKRNVKFFAFLLSFILISSYLSSQVTIGSSNQSIKGSLLDLKENNNLGANSTKGLLLPRMELRTLKSMYPVFEDSELTDEIKNSHIGLTIFNLKDDYPQGLCRGVYVWIGEYIWKRLPEPCCLPLTNVNIDNTIFHFVENETPEFKASIVPADASTPITYEWYIGNTSIGTSNSNAINIPMNIAYNGQALTVKAYNDCTPDGAISSRKVLTVDPACTSITSVGIANNTGKKKLRFRAGRTITFMPEIEPGDATKPFAYNWSIGNTSISTQENYQRTLALEDNNKILRLAVSNGCTSGLSTEEILEVFTCPTTDEKKFLIEQSPDKRLYTFIIKELEGFTKEELADLGITIQWYKKQTKSDGTIDRDFIAIPGANDPVFPFDALINNMQSQDIFRIAPVVSGPGVDNVMDCPINNRSGYYQVTTQDLGGGVTDIYRYVATSW